MSYNFNSLANRYGLDGPGIESRCGTTFSAPLHTDPGAHPASYTMITEHFPGIKHPERGVYHPPPPSAEVKEELSYTSNPPLGLRGMF